MLRDMRYFQTIKKLGDFRNLETSMKNENLVIDVEWISASRAAKILQMSVGRSSRYLEINDVRFRIVPLGPDRHVRQYCLADVLALGGSSNGS